jgi:hypothetical protein
VGEHLVAVGQFHAKHGAGQHLLHGSGQFDVLFSRHGAIKIEPSSCQRRRKNQPFAVEKRSGHSVVIG